MVLLQHWGSIAEQVLAEQLWVQVPDLFDYVPYDSLFVAQLRGNRVDEDGTHADDSVSGSVFQDRGAQLCVLYLGCFREHIAPILACIVQPGYWGYDAVFHCGFCLHHDFEEGGLAYLFHPRSCCHWCHHRKWGMSFSFLFF